MTLRIITCTIVAAFFVSSCGQTNKTRDTVMKTESAEDYISVPIDTPKSFVKNYGFQDSNPLFVFVGEKLMVESLPSKRGSMDNSFKARYLVVEKVFGNFSNDTIEFVVYDHYGKPSFSKFNTALLYVSADSGTYYHQKYLYDDVYKTKDGRWAGPYSDDYEHESNKHTKIKPVKIDFINRVAYPISIVDDDGIKISYSYPKPFFKTDGDSAIAIYGNYIEDLFKLKKNGVLKARRIFDQK